uniref:Late embryogenesis abundant protein LEA-2 subgroup domain-containing protein n=1 Tax=Ananas comosus var. bracteatus TaxID=296719 RepID=A0A6V7NHJ2_ANACO|nr:unnamed protein product [Ananas comosus var. bracteatus]
MRDYTCCCITATCTIVVGLIIVLPIVLTITLNVRPSIEDATLTRFALVPKPTSISYNLSTVIRLHNPDYYYGIYFDSLEANFLFEVTFAHLDLVGRSLSSPTVPTGNCCSWFSRPLWSPFSGTGTSSVERAIVLSVGLAQARANCLYLILGGKLWPFGGSVSVPQSSVANSGRDSLLAETERAHCFCICFVLASLLIFWPIVILLSRDNGRDDHDLGFSIANASITRFAVFAAPNATAAAFSYDIRAAVKLNNGYHRRITYDLLAANYYFNGMQFAGRTIAPFRQDLLETAVLRVDVVGSAAERGSLALVDEFERGSRTGPSTWSCGSTVFTMFLRRVQTWWRCDARSPCGWGPPSTR